LVTLELEILGSGRGKQGNRRAHEKSEEEENQSFHLEGREPRNDKKEPLTFLPQNAVLKLECQKGARTKLEREGQRRPVHMKHLPFLTGGSSKKSGKRESLAKVGEREKRFAGEVTGLL